jgi:hypothetical protein
VPRAPFAFFLLQRGVVDERLFAKLIRAECLTDVRAAEVDTPHDARVTEVCPAQAGLAEVHFVQ